MKHSSTAIYLTDEELVVMAIALNWFGATVSDQDQANLKVKKQTLDSAIDKVAAITDKIELDNDR